jgi:hypothetical protein
MTFRFGQGRGMFDEGEGRREILEPVRPLDAGRLIQQPPIRCLPVVSLGCLAAQRRGAAAAGRAAFLGESRPSRSSLSAAGET